MTGSNQCLVPGETRSPGLRPSRISKQARPAPSVTSLLDKGVTARQRPPQYGQALTVSLHGAEELPIGLERIGFADVQSVRDRDLQLVEKKRLVFDQEAFRAAQAARRMRHDGTYFGVARNGSGAFITMLNWPASCRSGWIDESGPAARSTVEPVNIRARLIEINPTALPGAVRQDYDIAAYSRIGQRRSFHDRLLGAKVAQPSMVPTASFVLSKDSGPPAPSATCGTPSINPAAPAHGRYPLSPVVCFRAPAGLGCPTGRPGRRRLSL
jgi:hypothetical protein